MTDLKTIRYVAVAALYIAAAVIFVEGLGSEKQFLKATSWIPGAIMVALTLYERWLWKFPLLGKRPILSGTWKADLTSTWKDPKQPDVPVQRTVYFVFRQTATLLTITMHTELSASQTLASQLLKGTADDTYALSWIYHNTSQEDQEKSPNHYGSVIAEQVGGRKVTQIRGNYFTDRKTTGSFATVGDRKRRRASSLADAQKLFA
jgi:hypothetical protein